MTMTLAERCAHNNAVWCDMVCRVQGSAGVFVEGAWFHEQTSPPHYPNLVSLRERADPALVVDHVHRPMARLPAGAWGVKDSFCSLDLSALGFAVLFDAHWIALPSDATATASTGLHWTVVTTADELAAWEQAWAGGDACTVAPRLFLPALLADPAVCVLAAHRGSQRVAGAILNRSSTGDGAVVGLSNVHAADHDLGPVYASLAAAAQVRFPGLPLVGYENGASLDAARACSFEAAGPLRVWLRQPGGAGPT